MLVTSGGLWADSSRNQTKFREDGRDRFDKQRPPATSGDDDKASGNPTFAASELQPLSGSTTLKDDKAGYQSELVAYSQLNDALSSACGAVRNAWAPHVLIVEDRALLHADWPYAVMYSQIKDQQQMLGKILELLDQQDEADAHKQAEAGKQSLLRPSIAGATVSLIPQLPKIVGAIADIRGMFRTNPDLSRRVC